MTPLKKGVHGANAIVLGANADRQKETFGNAKSATKPFACVVFHTKTLSYAIAVGVDKMKKNLSAPPDYLTWPSSDS